MGNSDNKVRIIVAGGRDFNNYVGLCDVMDKFLKNLRGTPQIVCGMAKGADSLGERYAKEHNIDIAYFPADWNKHGNIAGFIRNSEMARNADALVAFWDGQSHGTEHMINLARSRGLYVLVVRYSMTKDSVG